jgi:hypothetical protein
MLHSQIQIWVWQQTVRERCLVMIELEQKCPQNVSDMRGNCLWISLFTTTRYRVFILCYEYPMSPFSLHIYKVNERMGIWKGNKGKWKQREWGEWVSVGHMCRAESVELGRSVVLNVLHAGIFLLDANMKLVLPFRSLVTIQSTQVVRATLLT